MPVYRLRSRLATVQPFGSLAGTKTGRGFSFVRRCVYHHQICGTNGHDEQAFDFRMCGLWLTVSGLPADAGQRWHREHGHYWATHQAVYELEHDIALLEADPAVDDGYRAPAIAHDHAEIRRLRAALPPAALALDGSLLLQPPANLTFGEEGLPSREHRTDLS